MFQPADPVALEKERISIGVGTVIATRCHTTTVVFYSLISQDQRLTLTTSPCSQREIY